MALGLLISMWDISFGGFVRIKNALILMIISGLLTACGNDVGGVAARVYKKTNRTDTTTDQAAVMLLDDIKQYAVSRNSISDQAIRKDTTGLRMTFTQISASETKIDVEMSFNVGVEQCSIGKYTGTLQNAHSDQWLSIANLGRFRCVDSGCSKVLLLIEKSPSQIVDPVTGQAISASVPVVLEDQSGNAAVNVGEYLPMTSGDPAFLKLPGEINALCNKPVTIHQTQYPVTPVDLPSDPDYSYLPIDDNGTWF